MRGTTRAPISLRPVLDVNNSARVDPERIAKRRGKRVIGKAVCGARTMREPIQNPPAKLRLLAAEPARVSIFMAGATHGLNKQVHKANIVVMMCPHCLIHAQLTKCGRKYTPAPSFTSTRLVRSNDLVRVRGPRCLLCAVFFFEAQEGDYEKAF